MCSCDLCDLYLNLRKRNFPVLPPCCWGVITCCHAAEAAQVPKLVGCLSGGDFCGWPHFPEPGLHQEPSVAQALNAIPS